MELSYLKRNSLQSKQDLNSLAIIIKGNKLNSLPINIKEQVYVYLDDIKYVKGKIVKTGQDEEDRWGDISYWVEIDTIPNKKFYSIYTKEIVETRLLNEIKRLKKDIDKKNTIIITITKELDTLL